MEGVRRLIRFLGKPNLSMRSTRTLATATVALACLTAAVPASARAQELVSLRPRVLQVAASTRAIGLGGAVWTGGNGRHAIFHHPGLIAGQGLDVAVGTSLSDHGDEDGDGHRGDRPDTGRRPRPGHHDPLFAAVSASAPWFGGTVAAGAAVFDHGAVFVRDEPQDRDRARSDDRRPIAGALPRPAATEFVAAVAFRRNAFGFGVGAAAKVVGQSVAGFRARTAALDVGLSRRIGRITAALALQHLGPDLDLAGRDVSLPTRVVLGAGTASRATAGPLDIGGAVQVAYERSGEVVPGGGVEVAYWPVQRRVFIVRLGAVRVHEGGGSPLTFGAGFEGDRFTLDYAYSEQDPVAGAHRFGISFR